jgi:hypothetical protein
MASSRRSLTALAASTAVAVALLATGAHGQSASSSVARTPWGDPDIQGVYNNSNESGIAMQRPAEFAGRSMKDVTPAEMAKLAKQHAERIEKTAEIIGATEENNTGAGPTNWYENYNPKNSRPWLISDPADGQMPKKTQEGLDRAAKVRASHRGGDGYNTGPFDGPEDLSLYVRCITRGVPGSMMPAIYGNSYDITQGPGFVAIRYEMVHETRVIPLDGRPHLPASMQSYMGDPVGHWDGDTLVVETTNFLEKSAYSNASDHLKTTERFTPSGKDIEWSITFDDPHTWVRPWTFGMRLTRDASQPLFEYACHEGNRGLRDILSAARAAEKSAQK